jgi:multidrug resistance efflux pump
MEARQRTARADAVRYAGSGMAGEERAARNQEASAAAQLALVNRRLESCTLRSPAKGFVLTRRPRDLVGTTIPAGRTVLEVAEAGKWLVEVRVAQEGATGVAPGQTASFSTPAAPGTAFVGRVVAVAPAAEAKDGVPLFPVSCEVDDPSGVLRPGMRGRGWVRFGGTVLGLRTLAGPVRWLRWKTGI